MDYYMHEEEDGGILRISSSQIQGVGVFSNVDIMKYAKVGIGIRYILGLFPYVTPFPGNYINHSWNPNCILQYNEAEWTYDLISCKDIHKNEEITIDYRNTPWYVLGPDDNWE